MPRSTLAPLPLLLLLLLLLLLMSAPAAAAAAAWDAVPPMAWAGVKPADFADHELEVPYHLEHLRAVANAVVEHGEHRGFIDLAVDRRPQDNKPHNARVLENHAWLSYFYTAGRPWNPYRGSPAVRHRLEAVLDRWCRVPSPRGHFSESGPGVWNLAATGFGVLYMSATLDDLHAAGAPPFDRGLLDRTMAVQRRAILAVLNDEMPRRTARSYHNQYTGVYRAAARYMKLRPDPEVEAALLAHTRWAAENTQSPAGFLYEANHPDFGYSTVYEANLLNTEPALAQLPAAVREKLVEEYRRYNRWQAANLLPEPDRSGYFVNAAVQNRTTYSFQKYPVRPLAALVAESWPFTVTDAGFAAEVRRRRADLAKGWPRQPPLAKYSARDSFFPRDGLPGGFPTAAERDAAVAKLPYLARTRYAELRYDARGPGFLFVRRPGYYAALNFGPTGGRSHPVLGLGLLWNEHAGTAAQALPTPEDAAWGTKPDGRPGFVENATLRPTLTAGGAAVDPRPGVAELADGEVVAAWPVGDGGTKTVTFGGDGVRVEVAAKGGFLEQIPLVLREGDALERDGDRVVRSRGKHVLVIAVEGGRAEPLPPPGKPTAGVRRANVHLRATDRLVYTLTFAERP